MARFLCRPCPPPSTARDAAHYAAKACVTLLSCYAVAMSADGAETAIQRIERALERIEAAATRPSHSSGAAKDRMLAELSQRHEALLVESRAALGDLDQLIAIVGEQG